MKLKEIHRDCQLKLSNAIKNTYFDANDIIIASFNVFYSEGDPRRSRHYILPGSKKVNPPIFTGDSAYLKAGYEGNQISYPDGTFTGGEVLGATMTGTYGVVGDASYDEMAFEDIIKAAKNNFGKEFG